MLDLFFYYFFFYIKLLGTYSLHPLKYQVTQCLEETDQNIEHLFSTNN
jgi:hypothetical protein